MIQTTDRQTVRETERQTDSYVRLTIFTAAFVEWELIRPEMVASTTRPKAPEPSTCPEDREADGVSAMIEWLSHLTSNCNLLQSLKVSNIVFRCETIQSKCEFQLWYKRIWLGIQFLYTVVPFFPRLRCDWTVSWLVEFLDDFLDEIKVLQFVPSAHWNIEYILQHEEDLKNIWNTISQGKFLFTIRKRLHEWPRILSCTIINLHT